MDYNVRVLGIASKGMKPWAELYGNSSVTKPIGKYCGGSLFRETDTGKKFRYDDVTRQWYEESSGGGGSAEVDDITIGKNAAGKLEVKDGGISTAKLDDELKTKIDKGYVSLERLGNYLYKATFDTIPEYVDGNVTALGGCTAFFRNGKMYRNFDYKYDNTATFVVKCKTFEGIGSIVGLNDGNLDMARLGQLPYHLVDGVNDDGIKVSTHILYNDFGYAGSGAKDKRILGLPYFILSNVNAMADLETTIADYLANLSIPAELAAMEYLVQFLVGDGTTIKAITPKTDGSGYEVVDVTSVPKMANFKPVNRAEVSRTDGDIQLRPTGIERWNLVGADTTLAQLKFTLAYESPDRLSEFIGIDGTTKASTDEELTAIYNEARAEYLTRTRDGATWQTVHSVVYGSKGIESLCVQEDYTKNYIPQNEEPPVTSVNEKTGDVVLDTTDIKDADGKTVQEAIDNRMMLVKPGISQIQATGVPLGKSLSIKSTMITHNGTYIDIVAELGNIPNKIAHHIYSRDSGKTWNDDLIFVDGKQILSFVQFVEFHVGDSSYPIVLVARGEYEDAGGTTQYIYIESLDGGTTWEENDSLRTSQITEYGYYINDFYPLNYGTNTAKALTNGVLEYLHRIERDPYNGVWLDGVTYEVEGFTWFNSKYAVYCIAPDKALVINTMAKGEGARLSFVTTENRYHDRWAASAEQIPVVPQNNDGICYANGKFICVKNKDLAYSTDGLNWTSVTDVFEGNIIGIKEIGGMFIAYTNTSASKFKNVFYTSTNAINWEKQNYSDLFQTVKNIETVICDEVNKRFIFILMGDDYSFKVAYFDAQAHLEQSKEDVTSVVKELVSGSWDGITDKPFSTIGDGLKVESDTLKADVIDNLTSTETTKALSANQGKELNDRVSAIELKPDVVDIVQCYDRGTDTTKTDIVHYDLTTLFANDIVKVITDETHSNLTSYYKVVESGTPAVKSFVYVASDTFTVTKLDPGTSISTSIVNFGSKLTAYRFGANIIGNMCVFTGWFKVAVAISADQAIDLGGQLSINNRSLCDCTNISVNLKSNSKFIGNILVGMDSETSVFNPHGAFCYFTQSLSKGTDLYISGCCLLA